MEGVPCPCAWARCAPGFAACSRQRRSGSCENTNKEGNHSRMGKRSPATAVHISTAQLPVQHGGQHIAQMVGQLIVPVAKAAAHGGTPARAGDHTDRGGGQHIA